MRLIWWMRSHSWRLLEHRRVFAHGRQFGHLWYWNHWSKIKSILPYSEMDVGLMLKLENVCSDIILVVVVPFSGSDPSVQSLFESPSLINGESIPVPVHPGSLSVKHPSTNLRRHCQDHCMLPRGVPREECFCVWSVCFFSLLPSCPEQRALYGCL